MIIISIPAPLILIPVVHIPWIHIVLLIALIASTLITLIILVIISLLLAINIVHKCLLFGCDAACVASGQA